MLISLLLMLIKTLSFVLFNLKVAVPKMTQITQNGQKLYGVMELLDMLINAHQQELHHNWFAYLGKQREVENCCITCCAV